MIIPRRWRTGATVAIAVLAIPVSIASAQPVQGWIGWGEPGALGLGAIAATPGLQPIPLLTPGGADDVTAAAVTSGRSYLLRPAGVLVAGSGTTGLGDVAAASIGFTLIPGTDGATAIAAGGDATLIVRDGHVLAFGDNSFGAAGRLAGTVTPKPTVIPNLDHVVAVAAGGQNSIALKDDGTVWAWGAAAYLGSAAGTAGGDTNVPTQVTLPDPVADPAKKVKQIAFGYGQGLALLVDGSVYAWGWNILGGVGNGTTDDVTVPVEVIAPPTTGSDPKVTQVTAGTYSSYALFSDGTFKAWGDNSYGELGLGLGTDPSVPVTVPTSPSATAVADHPDRYPALSKISAIGTTVLAAAPTNIPYFGDKLLGWGAGEGLGFSGAASYDFAFPYVNSAGDPEQGGTEIPQRIGRLFNIAAIATGGTGGSPIVAGQASLRPSGFVQLPFFSQPIGTITASKRILGQTLLDPATVTRIAITGPNAEDFELTGFGDGNGNNGPLPLTFQPGGALFLYVRFVPLGLGDRYATLQVDANGETTFFELTGFGAALPGNTPGDKGDKGDKGATGETIVGPAGRDGTNGTNGASGANGKDGTVTFVTTAKTTTVKRGHSASLRFTLRNATAGPIVKTTAILSVPAALKATGKRSVTVKAIAAGAGRTIAFALEVGKRAEPGLRTIKVRIPFVAKSITTTAKVRVVR
jgi:hypothetical protein